MAYQVSKGKTWDSTLHQSSEPLIAYLSCWWAPRGRSQATALPSQSGSAANLDLFDVLEVTVDHCIHGDRSQHDEIFDLVGRIPLNAHGVGLSIGTDVPLDLAYLDQVADIVSAAQGADLQRAPGLHARAGA